MKSVISKLGRLCVLALVGVGVGGCSSMLYYPTHEQYTSRKTAAKQLGTAVDDVWIPTSDQGKVHGWYLHAKDSTERSGALGVVLFFHGNGQNLTSHYRSLGWLVDHAFDVLIFDYRGYGLSDGEPSPEHTVQDGVAAAVWLRHQHPKLPILFHGQSLGGAVLLRTAVEVPEQARPVALVAESTFASYRSIGRRVLAKSWILWPFQWLGYVLLSDSYAPEPDRLAAIPKVVVHGTGDPIIPYAAGVDLFEALGTPKCFWSNQGGRHIDAFVNDSKLREPLVKFLQCAIEKTQDSCCH